MERRRGARQGGLIRFRFLSQQNGRHLLFGHRCSAIASAYRASRQAAPVGGSCCGGRRCAPTPFALALASAKAFARHRTVRRDCSVSGLTAIGPRSRHELTSLLRRCVQTVVASQLTKHAARADLEPALLIAPEIAPAGCRPPRSPRAGSSRSISTNGSAKARPGGWQRACEVPRSGAVSAARAARFVN